MTRLTGHGSVQLSDRLAQDLGLDSLAAANLVIWTEKEFGFSVGTPESLVTVGDVVLAASGRGTSAIESELRHASAAWLEARSAERLVPASGQTLTEVFLNQAARDPGRLVLADQASGEVSYRRLVLGVLLMAPAIRALQGEYVGIMLPASVGAGLFYLAALFAGKTPVMVNWTTGSRNLVHSLDLLGVDRVITAKALLAKLQALGTDLAPLAERFMLVEDMRARLTLRQKVVATVRSYVDWRPLRRVTPPEVAVVLFTSGSENLPKAVPLTHANILTNIGDVLAAVRIDERDVLIGMLPPFHSFGICVTTILPLCTGFRCVFHPNPTEAAMLARIVAAYRVTVLVGTPTFLNGIVRAARVRPAHFAAVRGHRRGEVPGHGLPGVARPMSDRDHPRGVRDHGMLADRVGRPARTRRARQHRHAAAVSRGSGAWTSRRVRRSPQGRRGCCSCAGPASSGVISTTRATPPFVDRDGQQWYRTGDLVRQDEQGVLYFEGRLKRFVKLGGEMVSLPAIEAVLLPHFASETDEGPPIAVEAVGPADSPEVVLFTVKPTDREQVNQFVRAAGLSPLYNVREVIRVDSIPVLGTGKTDYRGLKRAIRGGTH